MTSRKYHVDPKTGNMGVCRARKGNCHSEARMEPKETFKSVALVAELPIRRRGWNGESL